MRQTEGDMFKGEEKIILIPTNGTLNKHNSAVMGAGIAKRVRDYPTGLLSQRNITTSVEAVLGRKLRYGPNIPYSIGYLHQSSINKTLHWSNVNIQGTAGNYKQVHALYSFPTKYHFKNIASIELIRRSAELFREVWLKLGKPTVALPEVGCGYGKLRWRSDVEPILQSIFLEDLFCVYKLKT